MTADNRARIVIQGEDRFSRVFQDFDRRIQGANRTLDTMGQRIGAVGLSLGALAGGLSVAGLLAGIRQVADGLDALNDAADATGSSIENLSALEDIGRRTGTSFEVVTGALLRFNQQLQAAQAGAEGPQRVLAAIGLEASRLAALDPADALKQTADALALFANNGDKARAVQELFGKSIREVAPFLNDLAEAQSLQAKATKEQAEQAEVFNKQIAALNASATDLSRTLLDPVITAINNVFAVAKREGGFGGLARYIFGFDKQSELQAQANAVSATITRLTDDIARMNVEQTRNPTDALARRIEAQRRRLAELMRESAGLSEQLKVSSNEVLGDPTAYRDEGRNVPPPSLKIDTPPVETARVEVERLRETIKRVRVLTADLRVPEGLFDGIQRGMERAQAEANDAADGLHQSVRLLNASLIADDQARGEAQIEIERSTLQRRLDELRIGGADVLAAQEELNTLVLLRQAQLTEELKPSWQRMLDEWSLISNDMGKQFDTVMDGVVVAGENAIEDFIKTGRLNLNSFADMVTQVIARLIAQQATLKLFNLAGDAFIGATGGFALAKGGAFDGGGAPMRFAAGGVFGDIVSSPTLFGFAGGRRRGLMGEAGPEAVMPLARGADGRLGVRNSGPSSSVINLTVQVQAAPGMSRETAQQQGFRVGQGIQRAMARAA